MERLWEKISCPSQRFETKHMKIYVENSKMYANGIPQEVNGESRKELHNYWLKISQI